jgi:ACS family hexuronate transporter-like MFS transporter
VETAEKEIGIPVAGRQSVNTRRWVIAGLLALATALSYLDRQSFPTAVSEVRKEIPISNEQFARLNSLFLLAYAIMYAGGGRILDWLGTRVGYSLMIIWWSAANLTTGLVSNVFGLGVCRFMLGMGEGGGFPGSGKAAAEWFPAKERSIAFGIFNTGSALGSVIAPPLIAAIVHYSNWRWIFFLTGSIGFIWAVIWLNVYRPGALAAQALAEKVAPIPWLDLFRYREVLGLMTAKFLTDSAWFFFIFWLPKYLADVRHLDIKQIGYFAWMPYAAGGLGSLVGGTLGAYLIARGISLDRSRKITLGMSACLLPAALFIAAAPLGMAIVFFSLAMFAHQFWSSNIQTLPADLFPSRVVGSVEGLLGSAGAFGGMIFGLWVGHLVDARGYGPAFLIAGILHPLSFALILLTVPKIAPLRLPRVEESI